MDLQYIAGQAKNAAIRMAALDGEVKNQALAQIVRALEAGKSAIIDANQQDMAQAATAGLAAPLLKRLRFDESKITEACAGLLSLIQLPDPVGATLSALELDQDLELFKVSRPIGVIGVIFESRPDALVQISSLCLKSGNAVLLKGGSEAARTNRILADINSGRRPGGSAGRLAGPAGNPRRRGRDAGPGSIHRPDHPRGSNAFVRHIMDNTTSRSWAMPTASAMSMSTATPTRTWRSKIAVDSKCQYVAVCNAAETMLVHQECAPRHPAPCSRRPWKPKAWKSAAAKDRKIIDVNRPRKKIGAPNTWT
jgi:glutamate-5-semialdehyde dehydrogenase